MKKKIRAAGQILDWIYPRRCPVCDDILGKKETYICRNCAGKLKPAEEPRCRKCSRPIRSWTEEYCAECGKGRHVYEKGYAVYPYHGPIRESLMRFKYSGRQEYAGFYARAIAVYGRDEIRRMRPELLVPVPIHRKKLQKRGYNQAEVLARRLAEETGLPVEHRLVLRKKNTLPQKELSPEERRKNSERSLCASHSGAAAACPESAPGRRYLYHRQHRGRAGRPSETGRRGGSLLCDCGGGRKPGSVRKRGTVQLAELLCVT